MQINKLRLPKAFTLKWIEALRSGEYTQGDEYLCEGHKVDENTNDGIFITYLKSKYAERLFPDAIPEYLLSRVDSTGGIKLSFEEIADFIEQEFELYD